MKWPNNIFGVATPSLGTPSLKAPVMPTSAPAAPADSSNLTIEQLRNLDRALTPVELARLDAADQATGDAQAKAVEAQGGPKAAVVSVGPKGVVIQAEKVVPFWDKNVPGINRPAWQVALGALGVVVIAVGVGAAVSSSRAPVRRRAHA